MWIPDKLRPRKVSNIRMAEHLQTCSLFPSHPPTLLPPPPSLKTSTFSSAEVHRLRQEEARGGPSFLPPVQRKSLSNQK
ncbi:hypothetical protein E2C01_029166 [Portunus trituberculatus]|uniref:Uncharacterized protein n=1 Tax=Portunus trituberculatus TaxID=210409 RepID=A0A5B7ENF6_PORTR|nr:hypothetical protein [Portunus trituberculatus]